jgi:V/A-type H+-transporting ATPase subunit G/H
MKSEILNEIKKAEDAYRALIAEAQAEKKRSLASAELEADNLVMKATHNAEEYKKKRLAEARDRAATQRAAIIGDGEQRAAAIAEKGRNNLDRAVNLLVSRFKEQLHAGT